MIALSIAFNPFLDPYGKGFQMSQSYYAMHNGGLFGLGLGNSITKKGYLPVAETDFYFFDYFRRVRSDRGLTDSSNVIFDYFALICLECE